MTKRKNPTPRFAVCVSTDDPDLLTPRMIYQVLPDDSAARSDYVRVIDNEGEDYLYPAKYFVFVELPRAVVVADKIAEIAEFFSFGTNDLTQTTFGFSRDDAAKFIDHYKTANLMEADPFAVLDRQGVGALMRQAIAGGRKTRPGIKLGICGEHGGEPSSVKFCHRIGLAYVSCSPFRVPIARLAAAQAAIEEAAASKKKKK